MGSGEAVGRRGFTLLELIVTLFVIALVTAIAVPTIGRSTEAVRVRADVAAFSAMLRHARERAITTRKAHAVVVDPGARRLNIVSGRGDGEVRESRALPERMEIVAGLASVDWVILFRDATPLATIRALRPDVLAKGGDWPLDRIVGRREVEGWGGRVVSLPETPGVHTRELIARVRDRT